MDGGTTTTREGTTSTAKGSSRPDTSARAHQTIGAGEWQQHGHLEDFLHRHCCGCRPDAVARTHQAGQARPGPKRTRKVPATTLLHVGHAAAALKIETIGPAGPRRAREALTIVLQQGRLSCLAVHVPESSKSGWKPAGRARPALTQIGPDRKSVV